MILNPDDEKEKLLQELAKREQEITRQYKEAVKRTMETPANRIKPRTVKEACDPEAHKRWQTQELLTLKQEYELRLKEESSFAKQSMMDLDAKWAALNLDKDRETTRKLREALMRSAESGFIQTASATTEEHELENRCKQLERSYHDSLGQIAKLTAMVHDVNLRCYVTHGKWVHRSCYTDATEPLMTFINRIQPLPTAILGCVRLPYLHVWVRDEGTPTGMTYTLERQLFNAEKITTMLTSGQAILLGATSAGDAYFLRIDNPVTLPNMAHGAVSSLSLLNQNVNVPANFHSDGDISGVCCNDDELHEQFLRLKVDEDNTIDAAEFIAMLKATAAQQALEGDDKRIDNIVNQYNLPKEGRMTFDQFALIMLKIAQL